MDASKPAGSLRPGLYLCWRAQAMRFRVGSVTS
jgi:hypothetical protein